MRYDSTIIDIYNDIIKEIYENFGIVLDKHTIHNIVSEYWKEVGKTLLEKKSVRVVKIGTFVYRKDLAEAERVRNNMRLQGFSDREIKEVLNPEFYKAVKLEEGFLPTTKAKPQVFDRIKVTFKKKDNGTVNSITDTIDKDSD